MNEIKVLADLEVGGQRGRVYDSAGIAAALSATGHKDPPKIIVGDTHCESDTGRKHNPNIKQG